VQPTDRSSFRPALGTESEPRLRSLAERAQWLDILDRQLRQSLPPELANRCRLANVRAGRLVFLVDAAALSTRLRLHTPPLLEAARKAGLEVTALTVKVATMQPVPPDATPRTPLSPAAGRSLRATADSITDPELRAQLLRLASLAEK
jgi:hypothetical protein